eukprot:1160095-Pelagomonas_calceolata.AAC.9
MSRVAEKKSGAGSEILPTSIKDKRTSWADASHIPSTRCKGKKGTSAKRPRALRKGSLTSKLAGVQRIS